MKLIHAFYYSSSLHLNGPFLYQCCCFIFLPRRLQRIWNILTPLKVSPMPFHRCMRSVAGMEVKLHEFLTSPLRQRWASHSSHFTTVKWPRGTHWTGGWMGLESFLNIKENRKFHVSLLAFEIWLCSWYWLNYHDSHLNFINEI